MITFNSKILRDRILDFCSAAKLLQQNDHILAAVSGGLDSIVLLNILTHFREELNLKLGVIHFNHMLRDRESDKDEIFVKQLADRYGIRFFSGSGNTSEFENNINRSIQEKARILRYGFFEKILGDTGASKIAMGHNKNDQAETVLLQFLKGGSFHSLQGIPLKRGPFIRPMLEITREDIREYAKSENLAYREDSSNASVKYDRNYIRLELLPRIIDYVNKDVINTLAESGKDFGDYVKRIDADIRKKYSECLLFKGNNKILLDINSIKTYFIFEKILLLRIFAQQLCDESTFLNKNFKSLLENFLKKGTSGKSLKLSPSLQMFIDRERLALIKSQPKSLSQNIKPGFKLNFKIRDILFKSEILDSKSRSLNSEWQEVVDYEKCFEPLTLRFWQPGDRFQPLGLNKDIKLKKFFINEKVPVYEKQTIPLLARENEILWVAGHRISEKIKCTSLTKTYLGLYCDYENKQQQN